MLNYVKKYFDIYIFCLLFIMFVIFMVLDIQNLYQKSEKRRYKNIQNDEVIIEEFYMQVIQKHNENKTKEVIKPEVSKPQINNDKIDIYSTNPWRIKIPKLRLNAPIAEGTSQEALRRTVGHFEQTDKWEGNVCLAGHNRGYRCNFFGEIKRLKKGDIIIYCTKKGERKYRVTVNTIIKETDWSYIKDTKDNRITLITCEMNKREYRRCIQGVEIKNL